MLLLFYATLFVLGLGLHFVGSIVALTALGKDGYGYARSLATIGMTSAYKPMLSVNNSNELTLKRRQYDEHLDREKITYGGGLLGDGVTRYLRDPQNRLHRFFGVRFGFVDERTGLVFDPRDADAGTRSREHEEAGSLAYAGEPQNGRIPQYVRAVFGMEKGDRGVRLRDVQSLIGGSADSQSVDWLVELYKKSQEPRAQGLSVWKLLAPVAALAIILMIGAFVGGGGGGGGGSSSGGKTVSVGASLLLLVASSNLPFETTRQRLVAGGFATIGLVLAGGLFLVFPTGVAWTALLSFGLGLVFLPGVAFFLGRSLGVLGLGLAKLYLILACFPFDQPVIHLGDNNQYSIREWDELDQTSEPEWFRFAKTWIGVSYENTEDVWPGRGSVLDADDLADYAGSGSVETAGVPPTDAVADGITSGGHTGVVPKRPKSDAVYVQTKHTLSWFADVGRGRLLQRALKNAKEEHFGGNDADDNFILYMTAGFAVLGLIFDAVVFF